MSLSFDCAICMETKERNTFVECILPCTHSFCLQCVTSFEASHCPLCRHSFSSGNGLNGKFLQLIEQEVKQQAAAAVEEYKSLLDAQNGMNSFSTVFNFPTPLSDFIIDDESPPPRRRRHRRGGSRQNERGRNRTPSRATSLLDVDLVIEHV